MTDIEIIPHTWTFLCFSFDSTDKRLKVYLNSHLIYNKQEKQNMGTFNFEIYFILNNSKLEVYHGSNPDIIKWENIEF